MKSPRASVFDFAHVVRALRYSMLGFRAAWRHETAFRQEMVLFVLLAPLAFWLGRSGVERALLFGSLLLVLLVEILNSAIEAAVDRHGTDRHELSARAKDLGSAAVLTAMLLTAAVWALILWERFVGQ
ncbi:MAG: diacylglycerol kinase [Gammaproteobacteria bacterium]|nr:diacylglycerol kinase [Gammaproteobacteria bacterium]